jgi:tetratricopeptide (TPR) repeat protein
MIKTLKKILGLSSQRPVRTEDSMVRAPQLKGASSDDLERGNAQLAAGKLEEALSSYENAIVADDRCVAAFINSAYVLDQLGRFADAANYLTKAIQLEPGNTDALYLQGRICQQLGRTQDAIDHLQRAVALSTTTEAAYLDLCRLLLQLGQKDGAKQALINGTRNCPSSANLHINFARLLQMEGKLVQAVESYEKALVYQPDFVPALGSLCVALLQLGKKNEALECCKRILELEPGNVDAWVNRSALLLEAKRYAEALESSRRGLMLRPNDVNLLANQGSALYKLNRPQEAFLSYESALQADSNDVAIWVGCGTALEALNRPEDALAHYEKALSLDPAHAEALRSKASALLRLNQIEAALENCRRSLEMQPENVEALVTQSCILGACNRQSDAIRACEDALRIDPQHAIARFNRAVSWLVLGEFGKGWAEYEWRWKKDEVLSAQPVRQFKQPLWLGAEDLHGKTILLHAEQGLGDTIQFGCYAKLVSARGASVVLEVQKGLKSLMQGVAGVNWVIEQGEALPAFDYHTPLMSLPLAFKTSLETIPAETAYLRSDAAWVEKWKGKLGDKRKPRVGLVWSGNKDHKNDHNRSIPLEMLSRIFVDDVEFVSLQKEVREQDKRALEQGPVKHYGEELKDFMDTAGLVANMDLVISVDTSVAHLVGALGKPLWVLLPYSPDFRWLLDREDSPWYPSARLFRQPKIGDWDSVTAKAGAELTAWSSATSHMPTP